MIGQPDTWYAPPPAMLLEDGPAIHGTPVGADVKEPQQPAFRNLDARLSPSVPQGTQGLGDDAHADAEAEGDPQILLASSALPRGLKWPARVLSSKDSRTCHGAR